MNDFHVIEELCAVCSMMSDIIKEQSAVLAQFGAVVKEEEIAEAESRLSAVIGNDAAP